MIYPLLMILTWLTGWEHLWKDNLQSLSPLSPKPGKFKARGTRDETVHPSVITAFGSCLFSHPLGGVSTISSPSQETRTTSVCPWIGAFTWGRDPGSPGLPTLSSSPPVPPTPQPLFSLETVREMPFPLSQNLSSPIHPEYSRKSSTI